MISHSIANRLLGKHKAQRLLVLFTVAAAVLIAVGLFFDHAKSAEFGLLWLFEQSMGFLKHEAGGGGSSE